MLERKSAIGWKTEAVAGTAETTGFAYIAYAENISPTFDVQTTEVPAGNCLGVAVRLKGKQGGSISFDVPFYGSGTAATEPAYMGLLLSCGYSVTTGTFSPTSDSTAWKTVTLVYNIDGKQHTFYGARGTAVITGQMGKAVSIKFTFTGAYGGDADVAFPTITFPTVKPPVVLGLACTVAGKSMKGFNSFECDLGNQVETIEDGTSASGINIANIADRKVRGKVNPLMVTKGAWDLYGSVYTQGTTAIFNVVVGTTNGNKMTINMPSTTITSVPQSGRAGVMVTEINFEANVVVANDEVTIAFA